MNSHVHGLLHPNTVNITRVPRRVTNLLAVSFTPPYPPLARLKQFSASMSTDPELCSVQSTEDPSICQTCVRVDGMHAFQNL